MIVKVHVFVIKRIEILFFILFFHTLNSYALQISQIDDSRLYFHVILEESFYVPPSQLFCIILQRIIYLKHVRYFHHNYFKLN